MYVYVCVRGELISIDISFVFNMCFTIIASFDALVYVYMFWLQLRGRVRLCTRAYVYIYMYMYDVSCCVYHCISVLASL